MKKKDIIVQLLSEKYAVVENTNKLLRQFTEQIDDLKRQCTVLKMNDKQRTRAFDELAGDMAVVRRLYPDVDREISNYREFSEETVVTSEGSNSVHVHEWKLYGPPKRNNGFLLQRYRCVTCGDNTKEFKLKDSFLDQETRGEN